MMTMFKPMTDTLQTLRIIPVLLCALLLAGCSALRLGYNQAPELAYWWIDGYVDFTDEQSPRARESLRSLMAWHRKTQLPDYAGLLQSARQRAAAATDPAAVCAWADELTRLLDAVAQAAVPGSAEMLLTMTPAQVEHLARRLDKSRQELRDDFAQADRDARMKAAARRWTERLEGFYGALDEGQRQAVARAVDNSPFDPERWLAERRLRHEEMLASLRSFTAVPAGQRDVAAAQALARALFERAQRSPREDYRAYQRRLLDYNCGFLSQVHNATSESQRRSMQSRLEGWEGDVRALAAAAAR
jgi:hypothetical protein